MLTTEQPQKGRQPAHATNRAGIILGVDVSPLSLARMIWKRKLTILLIWAVITAITVVTVHRLPAIYTASALIILDSQKIPEKYVTATINTDVQDRFAAISQHILGSTQLKKLIDEFNLYAEARKTRFPEEIGEMMRRDISITPEKTVTGGNPGAFRVAYQGPDPVVVAKVVNKIANLYLEENLRTREEQAGGTSEFLDAQLGTAKETLDNIEATVSNYKVRNNGELPQQETSLNGILGRLQVELEANRDAINRAQTLKVTLENTLGTAEESLAAQLRALAPSRTPAAPAVPESAVERPRERTPAEVLRAQLHSLQARYSDEHPDVARLRALLESAERAEKQSENESARNSLPARASNARLGSAPAQTPVRETPEIRQTRDRISSFHAQLAVTRQEIETRRSEQKRILFDISTHQGRIVRLPIREQEMSQMTRDYDIAKLHYRSLLEKKISAEMAADMERRQKAERFMIADPARTPKRPARPNRPFLDAVGCLVGLAAGVFVGFGRELQTRSLLGDWQVPSHIPVIGYLPEIAGTNPAASNRRRSGGL